ncbi:MAG: lycopene cyclase domain-containing protein [Bacteroidia bacterium]
MIASRYTYLLVDLFCILFPFIFSFHKRIQFHKQWKYFLLPCLVTALLFVLWDWIFTLNGIWRFNPNYVTGLYIANLPIEEILFFLCIPYACVFSYYCFETLLQRKKATSASLRIFIVIASYVLLITGLLNFTKFYTSVTFILSAIFLFTFCFMKQSWLKDFFLVYTFILIPFFISNGILTGSFTKEAVVIYNDDFNLGIRLATIPVEDIFYGMLLLLMNVFGFEWLRAKTV